MLNYFNRKPEKVIFDHLPKCGGSTLNLFLEYQYSKEKIYSINGVDPKKSCQKFINLSEKDRYKFNLIKGHLANEIFEYANPSCLRITMLREPIDRIVSHYYYVKRSTKHYLHSEVIKNKLSLEEYVVSDLSAELRNWYVQHFSGFSSTEVERNQEIALSRALKNLMNYHLVGFIDEYQDFLKRLTTLANYKKVSRIKKANVTKDRPSLSTIPESTIKLIKDVNKLDCTLYSKSKIYQINNQYSMI